MSYNALYEAPVINSQQLVADEALEDNRAGSPAFSDVDHENPPPPSKKRKLTATERSRKVWSDDSDVEEIPAVRRKAE